MWQVSSFLSCQVNSTRVKADLVFLSRPCKLYTKDISSYSCVHKEDHFIIFIIHLNARPQEGPAWAELSIRSSSCRVSATWLIFRAPSLTNSWSESIAQALNRTAVSLSPVRSQVGWKTRAEQGWCQRPMHQLRQACWNRRRLQDWGQLFGGSFNIAENP